MPIELSQLSRPTPIAVVGDSHVFGFSDHLFRAAWGELFLFRSLYCPGLRTSDFLRAGGALDGRLKAALESGRVLVDHGSQMQAAHRSTSPHWRWIRELDGRVDEDVAVVISTGSIDVMEVMMGVAEPDIALPAEILEDSGTPAICRITYPGALDAQEIERRVAAPLEPLRAVLQMLREQGLHRIGVLGLPPMSLDDDECDRAYVTAGFPLMKRASQLAYRYKAVLLVNAVLRRLCDETAVPYIDRWDAYTSGGLVRPGVLRDFIHLSEGSIATVAAHIIEALELRPAAPAGGTTSAAMRDRYDAQYYLGNGCGGHEQYARFGGRKLEDPRLDTVYALANAGPSSRVLDVGCGRGELSYAFAANGAQVTALDYSPDAIALARTTMGDVPVRFVCGDATTFRDRGGYDIVVAADVIEHLGTAELDRLYANAARMLQPRGSLVVHTWPNRWMHRYGSLRVRGEAATRPRTSLVERPVPYEHAMHINEQRPNILRRQLRAAFEHVVVWVGTSDDPAGSLARRFSVAELRDAGDVYAVASHAPIDRARLIERITTRPLPEEAVAFSLRTPAAPARVNPGETFVAEVTLRNDGAATLASFEPNAVRFAYVWSDGEGPVGSDDGRSRIAPAAEPGADRRYGVGVIAPARPGSYRLRITLVQEFVRWFEESVELAIEVA